VHCVERLRHQIRNITMTSIALRPVLLFLPSARVNTTASISARKLSNVTPADRPTQKWPRIEKSELPHRPYLCECDQSDSHKLVRRAIFRGALSDSRLQWQEGACDRRGWWNGQIRGHPEDQFDLQAASGGGNWKLGLCPSSEGIRRRWAASRSKRTRVADP
jgi:hypothetical protein